jgi:hypothetical protein
MAPWVSSALSFTGGVQIGARALHVLNLVWCGSIARLSQWRGGGLFPRSNVFLPAFPKRRGMRRSRHPVGDTLNFQDYYNCCHCIYYNFTGTLTGMMEALEEVQKRVASPWVSKTIWNVVIVFRIASLGPWQGWWKLSKRFRSVVTPWLLVSTPKERSFFHYKNRYKTFACHRIQSPNS